MEIALEVSDAVQQPDRLNRFADRFADHIAELRDRCAQAEEERKASSARLYATMADNMALTQAKFQFEAERAVYFRDAVLLYERGVIEYLLQALFQLHTNNIGEDDKDSKVAGAKVTKASKYYCTDAAGGKVTLTTASDMMRHWIECRHRPVQVSPAQKGETLAPGGIGIVTRFKDALVQVDATEKDVIESIKGLYGTLSGQVHMKVNENDTFIRVLTMPKDADTLALVTVLRRHGVRFTLELAPQPFGSAAGGAASSTSSGAT